MQVQQLRERKNIEEMILQRVHVVAKHTVIDSVSSLVQCASEYAQLRPFFSLKHMQFTLSDDRARQEQAIQIFSAYEDKLKAGFARFLTAPGVELRDIARLNRAYELVRSEIASAPLDAAWQKQATDSNTYANARKDIERIFQEKHPIGSARALADCARVTEILYSLAHDGGQTSFNQTKQLAHYALTEAMSVRTQLIAHYVHAQSNYPRKLRGDSGEAQEKLSLHTRDCLHLEIALNEIVRAANSLLHLGVDLNRQLIIGCASESQRDVIARQLGRHAAVDVFQLIPYLAVRADNAFAQELLAEPYRVLNSQVTSVSEAAHYAVNPIRSKLESSKWNLENIGAPAAWNTTRGDGIRIAIVDTGIDYGHGDLASRFGSIRGIDFVNDGEPYDDNGHGTHVAGIAAGAKTGVAPGAQLYAVKVLDLSGSGSETDVLRGIEWAIQQEADVINLSLGSRSASRAEASLIAVAQRRGIAVCAAAGNDGSPVYNYPASHPGAISVAAVDKSNAHAPFSNYNDAVDLSAPGVGIYSTYPGGYEVLSGTSMAAPHVSGACALVRAAGKRNPEEVLKQTAQSLGETNYFGAGLIALREAVK